MTDMTERPASPAWPARSASGRLQSMTLTIGVDIGGTKVAAGVVDADGAILCTALRDTPADDPAKTIAVIVEVIAELRAAHDVE
ncbi:MAG: ROK family protein, partial [Mycobacteriales bacterium]